MSDFASEHPDHPHRREITALRGYLLGELERIKAGDEKSFDRARLKQVLADLGVDSSFYGIEPDQGSDAELLDRIELADESMYFVPLVEASLADAGVRLSSGMISGACNRPTPR